MSTAQDKPDVIVTWLQSDYGQMGRASDGVARALISTGQARRVAYVEPIEVPGGQALNCTERDGIHVYQVNGRPPNSVWVGKAIVENSKLEEPLLLNFGVGDVNWWFHHVFAPWASKTALITHDKLQLWPGMAADASAVLAHCRAALAAHSDMVFGLSEGAIDDLPGATYLGHGVDTGLELVGDLPPEPDDLSAIPHPRALYFGALSVRVDHSALRLLADAGVHVVLVGFAPSPPIAALIESHANIHFLGPRSPLESPAYLRHCDIGIVPHTDEPFTWSMEPHKVYNYAAAGLRTVLLNCACPPAFHEVVKTTRTEDDFVNAVLASLDEGPAPGSEAEAARRHTWASVGREILAHMSVHPEAVRS